MALRLYLDDCAYSRQLRTLLQAAGHTVAVPADAGLTGAHDVVHLRHAIAEGWVVVTMNPSDFAALHQECPTHPGIIAIHLDNDVARDMSDAEVVAAIESLEQAYAGSGLANGFHALNQWRTAGLATDEPDVSPPPKRKRGKGRPKR